MKVTLSLNDDLVREIRQFAGERGTTMTALIRDYLTRLVKENAASDTLERSFEQLQVRVGERMWTRADLHDRS